MPTQRLDNFGKINREKVLSFSWENKNYFGYEGDSLASALLANNIQIVGRSFKYHRPRGIMSCGVEESGGLVTVGNDDRRDPNVCATTQELYQGLITSGQNAFPNVNFDFGGISNYFSRFFAAGFYYKTFMGIPPFEWGSGTKIWIRKILIAMKSTINSFIFNKICPLFYKIRRIIFEINTDVLNRNIF